MEDVIEELLNQAETVPVALELPTDDQLVDAQEQIFLHIPKDYRDFLLRVSHVVLGSIEPATVADPSSHTYLPELCAKAWADGVPRHLLVVCEHANGYYCMAPEGAVANWTYDRDLTGEEWESIWEWARGVWLVS